MKCLETRRYEDYTYRRYRLPDGTARSTYEVGEPFLNLADLKALMRKARAGRNNMQPPPLTDPDKIDAVLEDLEAGVLHRDICKKHHISSKTIQRIKWGVR